MALPTDDQVRAMAREILAHEKYARWHQNELARSWLEWFGREMTDMQRWIADLAARSPTLFACFLVALGLVAVALFVHVGWTVRQSLRGDPVESAAPRPEPAPTAMAAHLAAGGRFLDAARLLQAAVLEELVRRRVLVLSPAESNGVLTARLQATPLPRQLADRTVTLVGSLERRWFRDRVEDEALYDAWVRLHGDLADELG